jgi:hypothetical protein
VGVEVDMVTSSMSANLTAAHSLTTVLMVTTIVSISSIRAARVADAVGQLATLRRSNDCLASSFA